MAIGAAAKALIKEAKDQYAVGFISKQELDAKMLELAPVNFKSLKKREPSLSKPEPESSSAYKQTDSLKFARDRLVDDLANAGHEKGSLIGDVELDLSKMAPESRRILNAVKRDDYLGYDNYDDLFLQIFDEGLDSLQPSQGLKTAVGAYINKHGAGSTVKTNANTNVIGIDFTKLKKKESKKASSEDVISDLFGGFDFSTAKKVEPEPVKEIPKENITPLPKGHNPFVSKDAPMEQHSNKEIFEFNQNPEYFRNTKNKDMVIKEMTPDEYIQAVSDEYKKVGRDITPEYLIASRSEDTERMNTLSSKMASGQVDMPILDTWRGDGAQEGLHRAVVAKKMGIKKIPVAVFKKFKE